MKFVISLLRILKSIHLLNMRFPHVWEESENLRNLMMNVVRGDVEESVMENYKIICSALNFDINKLVRAQQVHGNFIKKITYNDVKNKKFKELVYDSSDGFVTDVPGVILTTSHADCMPVFMFDESKKVVGLAHAGWRGTVAKIALKLAETFVNEYGSSKTDLFCAIGPGIGKCCFEVSKPVLSEFENLEIDNFYIKSKNNPDKAYIDISEVNKKLLLRFGIDERNIFKSDVCSSCNKDLLFSHRATQGRRGNNLAFISILD